MLRSWLDSANDPQTDFPIQNLPFGVFSAGTTSIGVAIGDRILDLHRCSGAGLLPAETAGACASDSLNALMALGRVRWTALRERRIELLSAARHRRVGAPSLAPMREAEMAR